MVRDYHINVVHLRHSSYNKSVMPIFEYVCQECSERFENLELGSRDAGPQCPSCESENLEKQLSVFSVNSGGKAASRETPGPCGSCGDPRGPGSCSMIN